MLRVLCLILATSLIFADSNFADAHVDTLAQRVSELTEHEDPLAAMLVAEELYYLSHESSRQSEILNLIQHLFDHSKHQDARVEMAFFLTQLYRQLGQLDTLQQLITGLGYVEEWQILGPVSEYQSDLREIWTDQAQQGAHRQIQWRNLRAWGQEDHFSTGLGHYGFLHANTAIFPNQSSGAYFTTSFELDQAQVVRLGLGFTDRIRVWINRTLIVDTQEDQTPHPDQLVVRTRLKKGKHQLTIYRETTQSDSNLGFFARLTNAKGEAIQCAAATRNKLGRSKPSQVTAGLSELLQLASNKAELGSLMLIKEFSQHSELGNPRDVLLAAYEQAPSQKLAEQIYSLTYEPNERVALINRFLRQFPDSAWGYTQLGQVALGQDRYWEARDYAQKAKLADPSYWPADILLNNTLASLRLTGEALRRTEQLSKRYPGVPWIMMDLCDLYWAMEFDRESERLLDDILAIREGQAKYTERKIDLLKRRGDIEGLDRTYRQLMRDAPYSLNIAQEYAEYLSVNRRFDEAVDLLTAFAQQTPENPSLLQTLGEIRLRRGDQDALALLKKSLALRPQNPALERMVVALEQDQADFFAAYRIESPDVPVLHKSGVVINVNNTVVKVAPDGQSSLYHQLEYEITDPSGITDLPGYSFSYAPLRQSTKLISAVLLRGNERMLITQTGRARISDPEYRMYYDLLAYQIAFPPLKIGDRIQLEYRIDDHDTANMFGDYFGDLTYLASRYPTRAAQYTVLVPKERKIVYRTTNMDAEPDITEDGEYKVYQWRMDQIPPYETESRMPGLSGYMPTISVSTFSDWQDMSQWYAQLIKPQLQLDLETKAIVNSLVGDTKDHLEILKRIHEYVVTHTRYVALEFGIHGFKPYPVNQVCNRQFGDCKDKASLMVAMLREAGVDANIAIVRTYDKGKIDTFPASLSYFNHAIAYVPEFNLFLDGTAEFSGLYELPEMDQGALALVVDQNGKGTLTQIPFNQNNKRAYLLDVDLNADGRAAIKGELSYAGSQGPPVRQYLSIESKLDQNVRNLMTSLLPGLEVDSVERHDHGLQEPIQLAFRGQSDKLLQKDGNGYRLPLRLLNDPLTQFYTPNSRRIFPVEMGTPREQVIRMDIATPDDLVVQSLPDSIELEDSHVRLHITFDRPSNQKIRVNYSLRFKSNRVEPSDYQALRDLFLAHDQALNQSIRWSQSGGTL
ncbi:MAG: DUF3857 domain-containing protein [Acidobacteria bacterium]|nr:DUF3857 domain-containing protein [Acidobacteriota bacterium]